MTINNRHKTLKWFLRLLIWPFIILKDVKNEYSSEREVFFGAQWFAVGMIFLVTPPIIAIIQKGETGDGLVYFWIVSEFLYFVVGVVCFFSEKITNVRIPWQDNGRW